MKQGMENGNWELFDMITSKVDAWKVMIFLVYIQVASFDIWKQ